MPDGIGYDWPPPGWLPEDPTEPVDPFGAPEPEPDHFLAAMAQPRPEPPEPDAVTGADFAPQSPYDLPRIVSDPSTPGQFQLAEVMAPGATMGLKRKPDLDPYIEQPVEHGGLGGPQLDRPDSLAQATLDAPEPTEEDLAQAAEDAELDGTLATQEELDEDARRRRGEAIFAERMGMSSEEKVHADAQRKAEEDRLREEKNLPIRESLAAKQEAAASRLRDINQRAAEKKAALLERAEKASDAKVDNDRWWSSRSAGQKFASFMTAAIGGFLNPGGRNSGLEMILGEIDKDIATQKANISNERASISQQQGLLSEMRAEGLSDFEAETTAAQIMALSAAKKVEAEISALDPEGTRYREGADLAAQLRASASAQAQKYEQEEREWGLKVAEHKDKQAETARKLLNDQMHYDTKRGKWVARPDIGGQFGRTGGGGTGSGARVGSPNELSAANSKFGVDKKDAPKVTYAIGGLDKPPIHFATTAERTAFDTKLAAGKNIVRALDKLVAMRETHGSSYFREDAGKRALATYNRALIKATKFYDLGVIAGPDKELVEGGVVGDDPNGWRNSQATLKDARQGIVGDLNADLEGKTKQRWKPARLTVVQPDSPRDKELEAGIRQSHIPGVGVISGEDRAADIIERNKAYKGDPETGAKKVAGDIDVISKENESIDSQIAKATGAKKAELEERKLSNTKALAALAVAKFVKTGAAGYKAEKAKKVDIRDLHRAQRRLSPGSAEWQKLQAQIEALR